MPRNVSQVCRSWRTIAKGGAKLWSVIVVRDTTPAFGKLEMLKSNMKRFLTWSRRAPLTVIARICNESGDDPSLKLFVQKLVDERIRWKRVSISSFRIESPFTTLDNLITLEELALRFHPGYDNGTTILNLSGCRRLQKLELDGNFRLFSYGPPMEHLKHVELSRHSEMVVFRRRPPDNQFPTPSDCAALLRWAPSLSTLILDIRGEGVEIKDRVIHLPVLEDFRISISTPSRKAVQSMRRLMDQLLVPSLKILHVEERTGLGIEGLIQRSKCTIVSVDIVGGDPDEEDADISADWLRCMPGLKYLKLRETVLFGRVLARLVVLGRGRDSRFDDTEFPELKGLRNKGLCPVLENVVLEMCYFEGDRARTAKLVNVMLRSRIKNADGSKGGLKTMEVIGCRFTSPELEEAGSDDEGPPPDEILKIVKDGVVMKSAEMYVKLFRIPSSRLIYFFNRSARRGMSLNLSIENN